jgi:hypothetical protein
MTPTQLTALKAAILADPALVPLTSGPTTDYNGLIALMALDFSPDWWVYKTTLTRHEVLVGVGPDATTFTWGGSTGGYINRSQGERDAFREMFNDTGTVNPSLTNIQAAFADIFSGAGAGAVANRAHISGMSRRKANRMERVFSTGNGSTASPGMLVVEGSLTLSEVAEMFS